MATKTSTVWTVEMTNWFGECVAIGNFHTKREADAKAKEQRRHFKHCGDPDDKEVYTVIEEQWTREA